MAMRTFYQVPMDQEILDNVWAWIMDVRALGILWACWPKMRPGDVWV